MLSKPAQPSNRRALILVPAGLNYFYEQHGRRLAEVLRILGFAVDVCTLSTFVKRPFDWCVLTNITEILISHAQEGTLDVSHEITPAQERAALDAIRRLRTCCRSIACCSLDCAGTTWYEWIQKRCEATGIETILDFGLHDQSSILSASARSMYHFVLNGLTPSEHRALDEAADDEDRPIPWSFVGHVTLNRAALIDRLVQQVDPCGFVYLPQLGKVAAKNSPHLNEAQYAAVLRRCRYHVWCAHHGHFYMESERFRMTLLAGCVPIKVVPADQPIPPGIVFPDLLLSESEVGQRLRALDFRTVRRRFREGFRGLPGLSESLAAFLSRRGIIGADGPISGVERAAA
jgi:hypothetical protein